MLEINHELVQKIARTKAHHSWAKAIMLLDEEEADRAEAKVLDWIEKRMAELYPGMEYAERMVRYMWLHLLEREAIYKFTDKNPQYQGVLPTIISGSQAVMYAEADAMYPDITEGKAAAEFLDKMASGKEKPNLTEILP